MLTNVVVLDIETTCNGPDDSPEAHFIENKPLIWGWAAIPTFGEPVVQTNKRGDELLRQIDEMYERNHDMVTIVAHNAKFDIKYLMKVNPLYPWEERVTCYCTMYAEYRLAGHNEQFMGLEKACKSRGIDYKKSLDLGALLRSGIKMENIPDDDLNTYVHGDVVATMQLFCLQIQDSGIENVRHGHIMALAAIENNGLLLDIKKAQHELTQLGFKRSAALHSLNTIMRRHMEWDFYTEKRGPLKGTYDKPEFDPTDVNPTAPRTISFILTGQPANKIAKGVKRKAILRQDPLLSSKQIKDIWDTPPTHLGYPMDEESLKKVAKVLKSDYIDTIMEFRQCTKLMNTYLGPLLAIASRPESIDGAIYPTLNYVRTATGRLSSSNPNGQNMPEIIRQLFYSRKGEMAEIDFKQLEVVALAILSGCQNLAKDLLDGADIHYRVGKTVYNWASPKDMCQKDRKHVKGVVFGVLYGGTAYGLSQSTGLPRKLVKQIMDSLYATYPGIAVWHSSTIRQVESQKKPDGFINGEQSYVSDWTDPVSKRKFRFKTQASKYHKGLTFRPTQIKNYPVQGFAGGDIVMVSLEKLWRKLDKRVGRLRMTVHDSIVVDWKGTHEQLAKTMTEVCEETKKELGISLPLLFDIEYGKYWSKT